jgi:amidase
MHRAVRFMKARGAEVIDIDLITDREAGQNSFQVMLYEYKDGLNKYLESLGPGAPVKNLEQLIEFNRKTPAELRFHNQKYLEMASEKGRLDSQEYRDALATMLKATREEGIDRVMDEHDLDAIVAPTGGPAWKTDLINGDSFGLGSSSPAARSGYPNITVPMGFIEGLPVGISFFGRAWSEPLLIEISHSFETGTNHRRTPEFLEDDVF